MARLIWPIYCNDLSRITPANCDRSGRNLADRYRSRDDNVQKILGAIGKVGAKFGFGRDPSSRSFFLSGQPIFTKLFWPRYVNACPLEDFRKGVRKFLVYGLFTPKTSKSKVTQAPCSNQPRGRTAQGYCSLHIVLQGPSFSSPVIFFVRRTV